MKVVQIVPHLPPAFEGVGSYATVLAEALTVRFGIATRFVVGDPAWTAETEGARAVPARTVADFLAAIDGEADTVLLHYSNYGYQRRGCPLWLVEGLARWRTGKPGRRMITLFHEVWASGPPWRSSFWLQPVQRRLAAAVAGLSGGAVTSLELYGDLIRPWMGRHRVAVMPVFSTVGEPEAVSDLAERARRIVVFGGAGVRRRTYGRFLPALAKTARELAAEEICDVGPAIDLPEEVNGVPVRRLGVLPASEVSDLLLGSFAGFLAYPPDFLPKSTIFAAYCAHGSLPVCAWERHPQDAALAAGHHYWRDSGEPEAIARAARDWYSGHELARQAETFSCLLNRTGA